MRRNLRPSAEPLEGRALLASDLAVSLTADHAAYRVGQPVVLTYTVTNLSDHEVPFTHGPSLDGIDVTRAGQVVWESNSGSRPQFIAFDPLGPRQSYTEKVTWDGRQFAGPAFAPGQGEGPPLTGTFTAGHGLGPGGPTATFTIGAIPPASNTPVVPPGPPAGRQSPANRSDLALHLTTDGTSYSTGQAVHFTLTFTNLGGHDVDLPLGPAIDGFVVTQAGQVVYRSNAGVQPQFIAPNVLHAHRSYTLRGTWDGRRFAGPAFAPGQAEGPPLTGTFQVSNQAAPGGPVATFSILLPKLVRAAGH